MEEHLTKAEKKEIRKQERQELESTLKTYESKEKMKKIVFWIVGIGICALAVWGLIALVNTPTTPTSTATIIAPKLTSNDITLGPKDAKVILIEYADFQCPACGLYHPILKQLQKDFTDKVLFVYRYFPLTSIHQNAMISARAAYAAAKQEKFWEMHDMLFEHQKDWATSSTARDIFIGYAEKLQLDKTKFLADLNSEAAKNFINAQEDAGTNTGVNSTPTFFLNGQLIQNPGSYEEFKQIIQEKLQ